MRRVALVSGLYDIAIGVALLAAAPAMARFFGVPPLTPPVFGDTNALFLIAVGLGYWKPWRDPEAHRWYLWLMGPVLKGAGSLAFIRAVWMRGAPPSFLVFALSDGALALWTLWVLTRDVRAAGPGVRRGSERIDPL